MNRPIHRTVLAKNTATLAPMYPGESMSFVIGKYSVAVTSTAVPIRRIRP